jgi:hypothetical protein
MSHDTDRTQSMFEVEAGEPEFEAEGENEPSPFSGEEEAPFDEMTEMELASEALEITDEEELEQFLGGNLFKKVMRGAQKFAESAAGQNLMRILKPVANQALPIAGATIGGVFGGPAGTMLGRQFGSQASQWFEIEPEGMSDEDAQFETARRFVRFAGSAARNTGALARSAPPAAAARQGAIAAARSHAPGLLGTGVRRRRSEVSARDGASGYGPRRVRGWLDDGRRIVLSVYPIQQ